MNKLVLKDVWFEPNHTSWIHERLAMKLMAVGFVLGLFVGFALGWSLT